ncbi:MAG TPA: hypothetical protein VLR46_12910, partial [Candidatus Dormibacteraeota bacterium]|nr:hypothetical protein [Candidatus Dormibacteraeota bacterium]
MESREASYVVGLHAVFDARSGGTPQHRQDRVGMHLHDRYLGAFCVRVFVECEKARLVRRDDSTNPGTRALSASSLPSLSRLVAMKMNGTDIGLPPWRMTANAREL